MFKFVKDWLRNRLKQNSTICPSFTTDVSVHLPTGHTIYNICGFKIQVNIHKQIKNVNELDINGQKKLNKIMNTMKF